MVVVQSRAMTCTDRAVRPKSKNASGPPYRTKLLLGAASKSSSWDGSDSFFEAISSKWRPASSTEGAVSPICISFIERQQCLDHLRMIGRKVRQSFAGKRKCLFAFGFVEVAVK